MYIVLFYDKMKMNFKDKVIVSGLILGICASLTYAFIGLRADSNYDEIRQERRLKNREEQILKKREFQKSQEDGEQRCYVKGVGLYTKETVSGENSSYADVYFITEEKYLPEDFLSLSNAEKKATIFMREIMPDKGALVGVSLRDYGQDGKIDEYRFNMPGRALNEKNMETTEEQRKYAQSMLEKILSEPSPICQTDADIIEPLHPGI